MESAHVHKHIRIQCAGLRTESCTKMAPHTQIRPKVLHTFQSFGTQVPRSALPGCNAYWQKKRYVTGANQNNEHLPPLVILKKHMYQVYSTQHSPSEKNTGVSK